MANTNNIITQTTNLTVIKKKPTLKQEYNFLTKNSSFIKKNFADIDNIKNIPTITPSEYKELQNIINILPQLDIPKNSTARKSFVESVRIVFSDRDRFHHNFKNLIYSFDKLKNGEVIEKVVVNKPTINIHKKRAYVVKFFKDIIASKDTEKSVKMLCQTIITRVQNSNDYTPNIYTDIKRGFLTKLEVIDFTHKLIKDYNLVSSHVLFSLAGNKNELKKIIDKTIEENINLSVVTTVAISFIGSGSEYMNILPKIEDKNVKVIFNSYENTTYQMFKDIQSNREALINEIKLVEVEQVEFTKNKTNPEKDRELYRAFNKSKLEELNKLENKGEWGVRTSALFLFIAPKGFGGNLEWIKNETKISFPLDMDKSIRSVSSKVEYFGHLMDKCDITIENESFEVIMDKYDSKTTLHLLDPQYVKEDSEILESTRTTYGNKDFPHELCIDMTTKLQGQFLYHNYKNYKLTELMTQEHMECVEYTKLKKNAKAIDGKYESCTEVIYHSKKENFISIPLNTDTYEPQRMVS